MRRRIARLGSDIGDGQREIGDALLQIALAGSGHGPESRCDGRKRRALPPRNDLALTVERRGEELGVDRVVIVVAQVVLARPLHAHRRARLAREERRFRDEVGFRLAPESAAEKSHVAGRLLLGNAEHARDLRARRLRILRRGPHFARAVGEPRDGRGRLHRDVSQVRHVILGLDHARRLGERGVDVAHVARRLARSVHRRAQLPPVRVGIVGGVRSQVPLDVQIGAAAHRRPGVVGQHRNAAPRLEGIRRLRLGHGDDALDARHGERAARVEAHHLSTHDGRPRDDGDQHPVEPHVRAELRRARDAAPVTMAGPSTRGSGR